MIIITLIFIINFCRSRCGAPHKTAKQAAPCSIPRTLNIITIIIGRVSHEVMRNRFASGSQEVAPLKRGVGRDSQKHFTGGHIGAFRFQQSGFARERRRSHSPLKQHKKVFPFPGGYYDIFFFLHSRIDTKK